MTGAAYAGVVHSAFRRAVNIACLSDGELHTLVTGDLDDGPNALVVAVDDFLAIGICPGLAIGSSSGTEIAFGVIRGLASLIDNGEWDDGHQDRH